MFGSTAAVRFGTTGWDYADWAGLVYPAGRDIDRLAAVARYVHVLEIAETERRLPSDTTLAGWVRGAHGAGVKYSICAPRALVDAHHSVDEALFSRFRALLTRLQEHERLAAVLFTVPFHVRHDRSAARHLRDLLSTLDDFPRAVEFRHASWNDGQVLGWLAEHRVAFCNVDLPPLPGLMPATAHRTARLAYVRLQGRNAAAWFVRDPERSARHDYAYAAAELRPWAARIDHLAHDAAEVLVIINTPPRGASLAALAKLRALCGEKVTSAPRALVVADAELRALAVTPS